uniref:CCHC-type domain-containing protein n=1 Tax=Haemonchus contortus TaxID=6289 RepID=A0A7I4YCG3_HAECO
MTNDELHEAKNLRESLQASLGEIHELIEANNVTLSSQAQKIEDLKSWIQPEFNNLQDSHNKSIDIIRAFLLKATQSTPSEHAISDSQPHVSDGGEGIEMLDQMLNPKNDDEMRSAREEEAKIIKRNGEFMEKVEEVDDEEANIVRRNDEVGNNVEVVDDQSVRRAQWQRRWAIEREIQRKYAEVDDLEDLVTDLDWEHKCEPRNFTGGVIRREEEKGIRCVFCERVGHHYSDACTSFKEVNERKRILQVNGGDEISFSSVSKG